MLQKWLSSYKPHDLFHVNPGKNCGLPVDAVLSVIPQQDDLKLGQKKEAYASYEPLHVPEWMDKGVTKGTQQSCMKLVGSFLKEVVKESVLHPVYTCEHTESKPSSTETPSHSAFSLQTNLSPINSTLFLTKVAVISNGISLPVPKEAESSKSSQSTLAKECFRATP